MNKITIGLVLITIIVCVISGLGIQVKKLSTQLSLTSANEKAGIAENQELKSANNAFQLTLDQLYYYSDSISLKLRDMQQELKIKDKNLKSMQLLLESYNVKDTIYLKDTIVIREDKPVIIDTCIQDYWNKTCVYLEYPNKLGISHEHNNEKYIMVASHKEPIKPKKCKIGRWFAKKHTVVEVTVVDKNPNVTTPKQRFIEIIK